MRFTEDIEHPPPPYMYSCKIEADAKGLQKKDGGMDSIKKALRSMFGRKKREQTESRTSNHTAPTKTPSAQHNEPARSDPLPPTHPLATRREAEKRLSPVQQDQDKKLETTGYPASTPVTAAAGDNAQERIHPAVRNSPPRTEENVVGTAITSDRRESRAPAPPPKDEGVADAVLAAPPEAAAAAPAVTEAQPAHIQSTGEPEAEPEKTTEEPTATDSVAPLNIVKPTNPTPATEPVEQTTSSDLTKENTKPNGTPIPALNTDDKMLVDEEHPPPAIKPIKAAPGMSATSGPLEDFPEGEFH